MNNTIIIVGAGQLGSRHLQGVLKYNLDRLNVYVMDPSSESLGVAQERAGEVAHLHTLHFVTSLAELPSGAKLAIVATNAVIREKVTYDLLDCVSLEFLILEKVLFQELDAFDRVEQYLNGKGVKTFVNHPRRLTPLYKEIAKNLKQESTPMYFTTQGESWDLGCNALHMIDLFVLLGGSPLQSIDTTGIDSEIIDSKRLGFKEFTGIIRGDLENGTAFSLVSFKGGRGAITQTISNSNNRWIIQEGVSKKVVSLRKENDYHPEVTDFFQDVQSNLTTKVMGDLFQNATCELPSYETASATHKIVIEALLKKYNSLTNLNETKCPIT
jgi:hypothetical protein